MQDHITSSGTDLSFYVVVVNPSGSHVDPDGWLASPASARPVLQSHPSTVPSAVRNASGDYTFSFSGLSPAISDGTVALVAVTGAINGTAWTPWYERVLVRNKATINSEAKAQIVEAFNTDTYAEPAQGAPGSTITLAQKIGYLYKAWRNRKTQTATQISLYNDDATTVDHKATISDNGTTGDIGEIGSGP